MLPDPDNCEPTRLPRHFGGVARSGRNSLVPLGRASGAVEGRDTQRSAKSALLLPRSVSIACSCNSGLSLATLVSRSLYHDVADRSFDTTLWGVYKRRLIRQPPTRTK